LLQFFSSVTKVSKDSGDDVNTLLEPSGMKLKYIFFLLLSKVLIYGFKWEWVYENHWILVVKRIRERVG
jgi:hypothetical protein